jgi:hypothetical protein
MIDTQLTTIPFYYDENDCKEKYPDKETLIADILTTIKEVLEGEVNIHPIKCNLKLDYQAVLDRPYGDNDSQSNRQQGKQGRN